jgi:hypothetical protein
MFSNKFDVKIVYVFKVGIILNFYSLGITILNVKFLASFLLCTFFLNLHYFFIFIFPTRIAKLRKCETKKTCWLGEKGGLIQLL